MTQSTWRLLAIAGTGLVIALCLMPGEDVPAAGTPGLDKLFHVLAFAAVAFAWRRSGLGRGTSFMIALLLGAATELAQGMTSMGRSADLLDLCADAVGAGLGVLLARRPAGSPGPES